MGKLRRLEIANGYVELLQTVEALAGECTAQLGQSDEAALAPYRQLQRLVTSMNPLQEAAEGAAPHLLDYMARQVQELRRKIQTSFAGDLEKTLKKMNWPHATKTVPLAVQKEWRTNVKRLLDLQWPELEDRQREGGKDSCSDEPPVLLPLEVMARPLEQRFSYHFSGNRPTNRLDKPEYFLSHITDLLSNYHDFLQNALQGLLTQHFCGSVLASTPAYMDATSAFITALLPMMRRKLKSFATQVSNQPQLLSHLVHEVMSFDTTLQETYAYSPASPSRPWRGLADFLLDTCGYFARWLDVERDFALSRYTAIIETPGAGELDYDSVASDATKPSKYAIRVNDLLETITERYRPLWRFRQKLRFLIDIQIAIFDRFYQRLHGSLEAYLTMTSSLARTVQGVSREEQMQLQGVRGLDRLCRVFGSADHLERAMRDWSDDVFFLDLWAELQARADRDVGSSHDRHRPTSDAAPDDPALQGALFDETAVAYRRLRVRSEDIITEMLTGDVREALRPYGRVATWASLSGSGSPSSSAELDATVRLLHEYLSFLARAVGRAPLRRMARQVCATVQTVVWEGVVARQAFSTAGAAQLATDVEAVRALVDRFAGQGEAARGMRRLMEGVQLLGLPVRGEITRVRGGEEEAAWGDDGDDEDEDNEGRGANMGLFEAERLIFTDNEHARLALERLGMTALSENDARMVLGKRVEVGS